MKILITGAYGFIGKNLAAELRNQQDNDILECGRNTTFEELDEYLRRCDFIFHLAGENRPTEDSMYMEGNVGFLKKILERLKYHENPCPIVLASSIQAELKNPYGLSKAAAEKMLIEYAGVMKADIMIYRFPNVFGKWSRPNYNSVIATFCYNIPRGIPITVNEPEKQLKLVYIDELIHELISAMRENPSRIEKKCADSIILDRQGRHVSAYCEVRQVYYQRVGKIAELIKSFVEMRINKGVPDMSDDFTKRLYSTYLSFLPEDGFVYPLKMNVDARGSFTEFIRTRENGQISVNISNPGVAKGNHWHHTKNEKFLVVAGEGLICLRKVGTKEIIKIYVSGEKLEVVDIPCGYTHSLINIGNTQMVTIIWANEVFNPDMPDTYYMPVEE